MPAEERQREPSVVYVMLKALIPSKLIDIGEVATFKNSWWIDSGLLIIKATGVLNTVVKLFSYLMETFSYNRESQPLFQCGFTRGGMSNLLKRRLP